MTHYEDIKEELNWLENRIHNDHIKHYEYKYFNNIKRISPRGFGTVYKANYRNLSKCFALKKFDDDNTAIKEIVNEVIKINIKSMKPFKKSFV